MRVRSFIQEMGAARTLANTRLLEVEIELKLQPGLPQIVFLGLPDAAMKESAPRIRSALRAQGFQLPKGKRVLVQLRPIHLRKTSWGLDLAVAAAILWETRQIPPPNGVAAPVLYGEVTLDGTVVAPADLSMAPVYPTDVVYTGINDAARPFAQRQLSALRDLKQEVPLLAPSGRCEWRRPTVAVPFFSPEAADLAALVSAGEHSLLVAGPAGSGKSTLVDAIPSWLEPPFFETMNSRCEAQSRLFKGDWRPVVRPHHSITARAMIGGGARAESGEIARAHGGVLIMDELLEFAPELQEALREPVETGSVSIARVGRAMTYDSQFLLLATTNFCDCGEFTPRYPGRCRCRRAVLERRLSRLRGPFADRFAIFADSARWPEAGAGDAMIAVAAIGKRVEGATAFRREIRQQSLPNGRLPLDSILENLSGLQRHFIDQALQGYSMRRKLAVLRVARTLADLDLSESLRNQHLDRAFQLAFEGHQLLANFRI